MTNAIKGSLAAFKARLIADHPADLPFAEQVIDWAIIRTLVRKWTSTDEHDTLTCRAAIGQHKHKILTLETNGLVWILFNQLLSTFPSSDATWKEQFQKQLAQRLGGIPGGNSIQVNYKSKASWRLGVMDVPAFLEVLDWVLVDLKKAHATEVALHAANRARA